MVAYGAIGRRIHRRALGALIALCGAIGAHAAPPEAIDRTLQLPFDQNVNLLINVHDIGMVSGGPAPVYLLESFFMPMGSVLPPELIVTRVENACMQIQWTAASDPFPESFVIPYTLIAGDGTRATGTLRVEQGGESYPVPSSCADDPRNRPPSARNLSVQTPQDAPIAINPEALGAASDADGNETLRLTDTACWTPAANGSLSRDSDDQLTYTPNPGYVGPDSFGYCVTDNPLSNATGVSATINVSVEAPGAPELNEDTATTNIAEPVEIDVLANDPVGAIVTIQSASMSVQGGMTEVLDETACQATVFGNGCIRYTPPPPNADGQVFVGTDSFTYFAADPNGAQAAANVTITVVAPPGTPEAVDDSIAGVEAGAPVESDVLICCSMGASSSPAACLR